jgi:hypothetical protein
MDYLNYVPTEIYKEVLFSLLPEDVISTCHTNIYAKEMCTERFYYDYIILNFDPQRYGLQEWSDHSLSLFSNLKINTWEDLLELLAFGHPILVKIYKGNLIADNVDNMEYLLSTFINVSKKDTYINLSKKLDSIVDQVSRDKQFYRTFIKGSTNCFEWTSTKYLARSGDFIRIKSTKIEGAQFNNKCNLLKAKILIYAVDRPLYDIEIQGERLIDNKIEITIICS